MDPSEPPPGLFPGGEPDFYDMAPAPLRVLDAVIDHSADRSAGQYRFLKGVNLFVSSLSLISSLIVIGGFVLLPEIRKLFTRLILYLSISDVWLASACVMGHFPDPSSTGCFVQSMFFTYFSLASIFWTTSISYALKKTLRTDKEFREIDTEVFLHKVRALVD